MNANAARVLFFVATVALLVAFSFEMRPPTNHPRVAEGMLGSKVDASSRNPEKHAAPLAVAARNVANAKR